MKTVIKPEYEDTWFAVPKVIIEGYMPTLGINAIALYTILSCFQDKHGRITKPLIDLRDISGMRSIKIIYTLEYLKRMNLVHEIVINNTTRALELTFKPESKKKKTRL